MLFFFFAGASQCNPSRVAVDRSSPQSRLSLYPLSYGWLYFYFNFLRFFFFLFVSALIHIEGAHKFRQCSAQPTQNTRTDVYQFYYTLLNLACAENLYALLVTKRSPFLLLHFSFFFFSLTLFADLVAASTSATVVLFFRMSSFVFNFFPTVFFLVRSAPIVVDFRRTNDVIADKKM